MKRPTFPTFLLTLGVASSLAPVHGQTLSVGGTATLPAGTNNHGLVEIGIGGTPGTLNIGGSSILNSTGNFYLGNSGTDNVSGTINQTGTSAVNSTGANFRIAHWDNNTSTYNIGDTASLSVTGSDLNVGWDGTGILDATGSAVVNATNPIAIQRNGTLRVSDTATVTTPYLNIGTNRGLGNVDQTGGTIDVTGADGIRVGHWGAGAGSTYDASSGFLNVTGGDLNVGWDGTATFDATGNANITTPNTVRVQRNSTLTVADSAQINASFLDIGTNRLAGNVVHTGGQVNITGANGIRLGHWADGANSTYTKTGGTINLTNDFFVGWDGTNNTFDHTGGTFNARDLVVQRQSTALLRGTSVNNLTAIRVGDGRQDGDLIIADTAQVNTNIFSIGDASGQAGRVTQTGGDVVVANNFKLGHWSNNTSTYDMSGGTLTLTATANPAAAPNAGNNDQDGVLHIGIDGTGEFTHTGGDIVAHGLTLDNRGATAGNDFYTMEGGTLTLNSSGIKGNDDLTTYDINLGGGTVIAAADFTVAAEVNLTDTNGKVTFDTNGNTIHVNAAAAVDEGKLTGTGGFIKAGAGDLILHQPNDYTGQTMVTEGRLFVNEDHSAATGDIMISNGAILAGDSIIGAANSQIDGILSPGDDLVSPLFGTDNIEFLGNVAFGAGSEYQVELGDIAIGSTDQIDIAGTLDVSGAALTGTYAGNGIGFDVSTMDPLTGTPYWIALSDGVTTPGFTNAQSGGQGLVNLFGGGAAGADVIGIDDGYFAVFYSADFAGNDWVGGNDILLVQIPEPSRALLLALGLGGLLLRRRR